jgi:hypothetical protein
MRAILCTLAVSLFTVAAAAKDAVKNIHAFVALCDVDGDLRRRVESA